VTGDTVYVANTSKGLRVLSIEPADPSRKGQGFQVVSLGEHLYVIPSYVDLKKYDLSLFDVAYLVKERYGNLTKYPIIVKAPNREAAASIAANVGKIAGAKGDVVSRALNIVSLRVPNQKNALYRLFKEVLESRDVGRVWLDKKVHAKLDVSVPLVGAVQAWVDAGVSGEGVRIAVLDTGIDFSHRDFYYANGTSKIVLAASMVEYPEDEMADPTDFFGHGTHVASIAAGTGLSSLVRDQLSPIAHPLVKRFGNDDGAVVAGNGTHLVVVWESNVSGNWDIWYMVFDGYKWSAPSRLTVDPSYDIWPYVALLSGNRILVAWHSNRTGIERQWYKVFTGGQWTEDKLFDIVPTARHLRFTELPNGTIAAVWVNDSRLWFAELEMVPNGTLSLIERSLKTLVVAEPGTLLEPGSLLLDSSGRLWVFWADITHYEPRWGNITTIYYNISNDLGDTWSGGELIRGSGYASPYGVKLENGTIIVLFQGDDFERGVPDTVYYLRWNGSAWEGPFRLLSDVWYGWRPTAAYGRDGLYVVFSSSRFERQYAVDDIYIVTPKPKYMGVAPKADLLIAKVLNRYGWGYDSWIIKGIEWAVSNGANIISMSLGDGYTDGTDPLSMACDWAVSQGVVVVVAAGNSGYQYWTTTAPGTAFNVITVGASDKSDNRAWFSSRGPTYDFRIKPDIVAPGVGIWAALAKGSLLEYWVNQSWIPGIDVDGDGRYDYAMLSGTSMATPHVAGAAALLLQKNPSLKPTDVKNLLLSTAKFLPGYNIYQQGSGRLNASYALKPVLYLDPAQINLRIPASPIVNTTITLVNLWHKDLNLTFDVKFSSVDNPSLNFYYVRGYAPNEWIKAGEPMGWHADDGCWEYTLPFPFPFYGTTYTKIYVSSNGLISFSGPDYSWSNSIGGLSAKLAIAPAWDDWRTDVRPGDDVYIGLLSPDSLLIRWKVVAYYNRSIEANFGAILCSNGTIKFVYGYSNGRVSATVGIGGDIALAEDLNNLNYTGTRIYKPVERTEYKGAFYVANRTVTLPADGTAKIVFVANFTSLPHSDLWGVINVVNASDGSVLAHGVFSAFNWVRLTVKKIDVNGNPAANSMVAVIPNITRYDTLMGSLLQGGLYGFTNASGMMVVYLPEGFYNVVTSRYDDAVGSTYFIVKQVRLTSDAVVVLDEREAKEVKLASDASLTPTEKMVGVELPVYWVYPSWSSLYMYMWGWLAYYPLSLSDYVLTPYPAYTSYKLLPSDYVNPSYPDLIESSELYMPFALFENVTSPQVILPNYNVSVDIEYRTYLTPKVSANMYINYYGGSYYQGYWYGFGTWSCVYKLNLPKTLKVKITPFWLTATYSHVGLNGGIWKNRDLPRVVTPYWWYNFGTDLAGLYSQGKYNLKLYVAAEPEYRVVASSFWLDSGVLRGFDFGSWMRSALNASVYWWYEPTFWDIKVLVNGTDITDRCIIEQYGDVIEAWVRDVSFSLPAKVEVYHNYTRDFKISNSVSVKNTFIIENWGNGRYWRRPLNIESIDANLDINNTLTTVKPVILKVTIWSDYNLTHVALKYKSGIVWFNSTLVSCTGFASGFNTYTFALDKLEENNTFTDLSLYIKDVKGNELEENITRALYVRLKLAIYTVTVDPNGGMVLVDGAPITSRTSYQWVEESSHTLEAVSPYEPSTGVRMLFTQWSDGSTASNRTIVVTGPATYIAYWRTQYALNISISPQGAGNTDPAPGYYFYDANSSVTVWASPAPGYAFDHWELDGRVAGTSTNITVTMDRPHSLLAVFKRLGVNLIVWRPSEGYWYILLSSTGYDWRKPLVVLWGASGDVPLVGDVDGDGKADLIVWRPSEGYWYILLSSTGYDWRKPLVVLWGASGDVPLVGN
jgi:subtilisin family serine protease